MPGHIDFDYDTKNDIVVATPHWHIKTDEDVHAWAAEYDAYFARFRGRKVDLVLVLSDFKVDARIGASWGEVRAEIIKRYTRFSYRVSVEGSAKTYTLTSGVRYNALSAVAPSVEDAKTQILRHRREETSSPA